MEAVAQFPRPETLTQLRAFLGLASYFRRFICGFAGIARPLHELLKKGSDVRNDWGPTQEAAFKDIKTKLTHSPVLISDDGVSEVELQTDASTKGIGAVLLLRKPNGNRPVTFVSRKLSPAEEKYHANELECLTLVWTLNKLRHHIYGRPMIVKTDSNVLRWLIQKKNVSGKFARWILTLQEYMLDVQHIRGSANTVADALSRSPVGPAKETNPTENVLAASPPAIHLAKLPYFNTPTKTSEISCWHCMSTAKRTCRTRSPFCSTMVFSSRKMRNAAGLIYLLRRRSSVRTS